MAKKQADVINDVEEMNVDEVMSVYAEQVDPVVKIGDVVHYVSALKKHRAAIVTNVTNVVGIDSGAVNLCVFYDGELDGFAKDNCVQWVEVVTFDPTGETTDTWHWMD